MERRDKELKIEAYEQTLDGAGFLLLTEHGKIPVSQVENMRRQYSELGCRCVVLKNTLARIVFERNGFEKICEYLVGPSFAIFGDEEIAPVAKLVQKHSKASPSFKVKAILFDGKAYSKDDFKTFTSMPTKHEIQGSIVGVFKAPIAGFVRVLNTPQRMVSILKAIADKREA